MMAESHFDSQKKYNSFNSRIYKPANNKKHFIYMNMRTIENYDITISLHLNADESVDLRKEMHISYPLSNGTVREFSAHPTTGDGQNYGTIEDQFIYAKSDREFEEAILKKQG